jgi:hypothetical protein
MDLVPGKDEVKMLHCQYDIQQFPPEIQVVLTPLAESSMPCKMYPTEVIDVAVEFASARNDHKDGGTAALMASARKDESEKENNHDCNALEKRGKWLVVIDFVDEPDVTGTRTSSLYCAKSF